MLHSHHIIAAQNSDFGFVNIGDMTENGERVCTLWEEDPSEAALQISDCSQDVLLSHICSVVIHLVSGKHAMFGKVDTNVLKRDTRSC